MFQPDVDADIPPLINLIQILSQLALKHLGRSNSIPFEGAILVLSIETHPRGYTGTFTKKPGKIICRREGKFQRWDIRGDSVMRRTYTSIL